MTSLVLLSRSIGGVFVDVVLTEEHTAEIEIAEHPVEKGAKISDHAWRKPYTVKLENIIDQDRTIASYEALLQVQKTAEPFDLVTGLKVYENMLISKIKASRDTEFSRVLKFECELQEVIIVNTQQSAGNGDGSEKTGNGDNPSEDAADRASSTTNRGQVQAREVTPGAANERLFQGVRAAQ